jgi:hypothetical protein
MEQKKKKKKNPNISFLLICILSLVSLSSMPPPLHPLKSLISILYLSLAPLSLSLSLALVHPEKNTAPVTGPDASVSHTVAAKLYDEFLASGTPSRVGRLVEFMVRWKIGTALVVQVPVLSLISV